MELRPAVQIKAACLYFLFSVHVMAQSLSQSTQQSLFVVSSSSSSNALVLTDTASTPCGTAYFGGCLSTAIVSACGDVYQTACICGVSGQGAIASLVGPCLLAECPVTEILAIGNFATSVCDEWLKTHTITTTGSLGGGPSTATMPISTAFSSVTTSGPGDVSITSSPTRPTVLSTITSTATPSTNLSVGTDVGIGVGALAVVVTTVALLFFCLRRRRRRSRREASPEVHELQTDANTAELPDKPDQLEDVHVIKVPENELQRFQFPFQMHEMEPVEADSQTVRAQSRGRVAGNETTAFDFESQKVLLTPDLKSKSRASSRAPGSSPTSLRRHNTDT